MPRKKLKQKRPSSLSITLFVLGFILILISVTWNIYQKRVLSFSQPLPVVLTSQIKKAPPERIIIEKFKIDLPIIESQIKDGVWQINSSGGSHLVSSANPGEKGNIIVYGHNKKRLFGKVLTIKVGDQIKIISKDGVEYYYFVTEIKTVSPSDIYVLLPTQDETLTFYTCSGWLDLKRFVVMAKPSK